MVSWKHLSLVFLMTHHIPCVVPIGKSCKLTVIRKVFVFSFHMLLRREYALLMRPLILFMTACVRPGIELAEGILLQLQPACMLNL
jgi:hypothetical protein